MTETNMPLIELLQKHDEGDFLRAVTETVLQTLMEHDVDGTIGAGRYERGEGRHTYRNGCRDRKLKTRMGALNLLVPQAMELSGISKSTVFKLCKGIDERVHEFLDRPLTVE